LKLVYVNTVVRGGLINISLNAAHKLRELDKYW